MHKILIPVSLLTGFSLLVGNTTANLLETMFSNLNLTMFVVVAFAMYTIYRAIMNNRQHNDAILVASLTCIAVTGMLCLLRPPLFAQLLLIVVGYVILITWLLRVIKLTSGRPRPEQSPISDAEPQPVQDSTYVITDAGISLFDTGDLDPVS
jgi:chromate transport protein ChrA